MAADPRGSASAGFHRGPYCEWPGSAVLGKQYFSIDRAAATGFDITAASPPSVDLVVPAGTVRVDLDIRLGLFAFGISADTAIGFEVWVDGVNVTQYEFLQHVSGHYKPHAFRILQDASMLGLTPGSHTLQLRPLGNHVGNVTPAPGDEGVQDITIVVEYLSV